jgi:hypothetical protein
MPARSYTLFLISATVSSSRWFMPNLARSGLKLMQVQLSLALQAVILGEPFLVMLAENTCL